LAKILWDFAYLCWANPFIELIQNSSTFGLVIDGFELLRLALSIKTGTVTASVILRKLAAYPRQNGLALALRELGKLERTFFTLQWLQDPELRRRSNVGLNKGEQQNALRRAVFFNRLGEIRDRSYENQRHRASGLNLLVAAIILAELHSRIHRGTYRALPSRRRYIPKPDGRQRPLGIAALEDKIVQVP
jgi:TnpA family transposase